MVWDVDKIAWSNCTYWCSLLHYITTYYVQCLETTDPSGSKETEMKYASFFDIEVKCASTVNAMVCLPILSGFPMLLSMHLMG